AGLQREFLRNRRRQMLVENDVRRWKRTVHEDVVPRIESRSEIPSAPWRPDVDAIQHVRVGDVRVPRKLRFAIFAGVMVVRRLKDLRAVASRIETDGETRDERVRVKAGDAAGGVAANRFEPCSKVKGPMGVETPAVLRIERRRSDVDSGAANRQPVLNVRV